MRWDTAPKIYESGPSYLSGSLGSPYSVEVSRSVSLGSVSLATTLLLPWVSQPELETLDVRWDTASNIYESGPSYLSGSLGSPYSVEVSRPRSVSSLSKILTSPQATID